MAASSKPYPAAALPREASLRMRHFEFCIFAFRKENDFEGHSVAAPQWRLKTVTDLSCSHPVLG
jgi:hypothetical protein